LGSEGCPVRTHLLTPLFYPSSSEILHEKRKKKENRRGRRPKEKKRLPCREHALTLQKESGRSMVILLKPNVVFCLSLSLVMGLLSIQDFYLSGNMYQEIFVSTWHPIPSHPLLSLALSLTHHLHTTASFSLYITSLFFKVEQSPTFPILVTRT